MKAKVDINIREPRKIDLAGVVLVLIVLAFIISFGMVTTAAISKGEHIFFEVTLVILLYGAISMVLSTMTGRK
jgi:hypothetical protein